jgi:hypothetical protein
VWPIGIPFIFACLLYYYAVPSIAKRKAADAEWRAYLEHILTQFIDRGLGLSGIKPGMPVDDLTDENMRSILRVGHSKLVGADKTPTKAQRNRNRQRRKATLFAKAESQLLQAKVGPVECRRRTEMLMQAQQGEREVKAQLARIDDPSSQLVPLITVVHHMRGIGTIVEIDNANERNKPYQVYFEESDESHRYDKKQMCTKFQIHWADATQSNITNQDSQSSDREQTLPTAQRTLTNLMSDQFDTIPRQELLTLMKKNFMELKV